jgi:uncharacterized protein YkwD
MENFMMPTNTTKTTMTTSAVRTHKFITLPRIVIAVVIICLVFQIQKSKSVELPKYTLPAYVGQSVVERVNNHRMSIHAPELTLNDSLSAEARRTCERMAKGNLQATLANVSLNTVSNKQDVDAWDNQHGMQRSVAVFECGSSSPSLDAIRTWLENTTDVSNIENTAFHSTGIGVVRQGNMYYVCQIFAARRSK